MLVPFAESARGLTAHWFCCALSLGGCFVEGLLTKDLCLIDGRDYLVHGVIEIPVHDYEYELGWGV